MHTHQHTNPLFQLGVGSQCRASQSSQTREHPKPQDSPASGKSTRKPAGWRQLCQCCRAVPWLATLCAAIIVGALVVWNVYTDRLIDALLAVLSRIRAPDALLSQVSAVVHTVQIAVLASLSSVMALLLLTSTTRKQQVRQKTRALTYTDWPQGWKMICYRTVTVQLLAVLWFICAALLVLLCLSVTASVFALVGDTGATKLAGLPVDIDTATNTSALGVSDAAVKASSTLTAQMARVPIALKSAAWYRSLDSTISLLQHNAASGATADSSCPSVCLDLAFLARALPKVEINATDTCVCSHDKLLVLQQQLHTMWQSGVAACIALAALLAVGSWMLMHGVADCVSAGRDHHDATYFQCEHQHAHRRESRILNWVHSSPASSVDIKADQHKQEQLIAPEIQTGSPNKRLRVHGWATAGDTGMPADIEQPAPHSDQTEARASANGTLSSQPSYGRHTGSLSSEPSYIRHTTASIARQADNPRSVVPSRQIDTVRSTTSANSYVQSSRKRWQ